LQLEIHNAKQNRKKKKQIIEKGENHPVAGAAHQQPLKPTKLAQLTNIGSFKISGEGVIVFIFSSMAWVTCRREHHVDANFSDRRGSC
jgi:hypothetical protein